MSLESFAGVITKAAHSLCDSYFKTLGVGAVWGLNPRPPERQ